jgi:lipid-A-disaccharide synthase-like uncharacterized protein
MLYVIVRLLKILLIVLFSLNLLLWLAAHASGHKIPPKTNWFFGLSSLVLILSVAILHNKGVKLKS